MTGASGIVPDVGMALVELSSPTPQRDRGGRGVQSKPLSEVPSARGRPLREGTGERLVLAAFPPTHGASHGLPPAGSETLGADAVTQTAQPPRLLSGSGPNPQGCCPTVNSAALPAHILTKVEDTWGAAQRTDAQELGWGGRFRPWHGLGLSQRARESGVQGACWQLHRGSDVTLLCLLMCPKQAGHGLASDGCPANRLLSEWDVRQNVAADSVLRAEPAAVCPGARSPHAVEGSHSLPQNCFSSTARGGTPIPEGPQWESHPSLPLGFPGSGNKACSLFPSCRFLTSWK